jgi:ketopantoate reductase
MARDILILGASYGSLLATKLLMAGHNVTLVCRRKTAELINRDGTEVRIKLRDEAMHQAIFSRDLPGTLDATSPQDIDLSRYDLVALAMQEPQYTNHTIRVLMIKIAEANLPCLSIMNMPPLALSQTDSGAGGHGPRRGLYQCRGMETVQAGTSVALLA